MRHYKNGMLKCEAALPVKDCTERTNLRKWGTGDMFFSYRTQVCATPARQAQRSAVDPSPARALTSERCVSRVRACC